MKYNGIIESKLRIIEEKLVEIESWNIVSFSQLRESSLLQNAVERVLQVCTEVMIDISERILALNQFPLVQKTKHPQRNSIAMAIFNIVGRNITIGNTLNLLF